MPSKIKYVHIALPADLYDDLDAMRKRTCGKMDVKLNWGQYVRILIDAVRNTKGAAKKRVKNSR